MPAAFARIDNMQPPKGPICMARVALYSKMWRNFDRGLYTFFKQYIFIPICAPTFSLLRKMFAVLVCYGFVLVWHGFYYHNYVSFFLIEELLNAVSKISAKFCILFTFMQKKNFFCKLDILLKIVSL